MTPRDVAEKYWRIESVFKDHDRARFRSKGANVIRIAADRFQSVHVYFHPTELDAPAGSD
jgi:hypothetical protein